MHRSDFTRVAIDSLPKCGVRDHTTSICEVSVHTLFRVVHPHFGELVLGERALGDFFARDVLEKQSPFDSEPRELLTTDGNVARISVILETMPKIEHPTLSSRFEKCPVLKKYVTYNFEVAEHHTYVADGVRVHNTSEYVPLQVGGEGISGVIYHDRNIGNLFEHDRESFQIGTAKQVAFDASREFSSPDGQTWIPNGGGASLVSESTGLSRNPNAPQDILSIQSASGSTIVGWDEATQTIQVRDNETGEVGTYRTKQSFTGSTSNNDNSGSNNSSGQENSDGTGDNGGGDNDSGGSSGGLFGGTGGLFGDADGDGTPNVIDFNDGVGLWGPVIIDLDGHSDGTPVGDGIEISVSSDVLFDTDGDGYLERTSWAAPDDGFLVIDLDENGNLDLDASDGLIPGDGKIDRTDELILSKWGDEGDTDLQALQRTFDSADRDQNILNSDDEIWNHLRVWQDLNQDGISDRGEVFRLFGSDVVEVWYDENADGIRQGSEVSDLPELAISEIGLQYDDGSEFSDSSDDVTIFGNTLLGTASYVWEGDTRETISGGVGDVALSGFALGVKLLDTDQGQLISFEQSSDLVHLEMSEAGSKDVDLVSVSIPSDDSGPQDVAIDGVVGDSRNNFLDASLHTRSVLIEGGIGIDTIYGGSNDDRLVGGEGGDFLKGHVGNDVLYVDRADLAVGIVDGGSGRDVMVLTQAGGLPGNGSEIGAPILVQNHDIEIVHGSSEGDYISGSDATDPSERETEQLTLLGFGGDDTLAGGRADDVINGGDGKDSLSGSDGDDSIFGAWGDDYLSGNQDDDDLYGDTGDDTLAGGWGDDALYGGVDFDSLDGGNGDDFLDGGQNADTLRGGRDDDSIFGGFGHDLIFYSHGDDFISGGNGNDVIEIEDTGFLYGWSVVHGGLGNDTLRVHRSQNEYTIYHDVESDVAQFRLHWGSNGSDQYQMDLLDIEKIEFSDGTVLDLTLHGANASVDQFDLFNPNFRASNDDLEVLIGSANEYHYLYRGNDVFEPGEPWRFSDGWWLYPQESGWFRGYSGDDLIGESSENDFLDGGHGQDTIFGGDGDDSIHGAQGTDFVTGDGGNDTITGGTGADTILGLEGNDSLFSGEGNDIASGGLGDDFIESGSGNDEVYGDEGDDTLIGGSGFDRLIGGVGHDSAQGGTGADLLDGGEGNDTLHGDSGADQLYGFAGVDSLVGGAGFDQLDGGEGNDTLRGGDDDDSLIGGDGDDHLWGDKGNDWLRGGIGADTLNGGDGLKDVAVYSGSTEAISIDLLAGVAAGGTAALDSLVSIEGIVASQFADVVVGDHQSNDLFGGDGDDTLTGNFGHDEIFGGDGLDNLFGGQGLDRLYGGDGSDTIFGGGDADTIDGGNGDDSLIGGDQADIIVGGDGQDTVDGGRGMDVIALGLGNDQFIDFAQMGSWGSDSVDAGEGNDTLTSVGGFDTLFGSAGDDSLNAGANADSVTLEGGDGNDVIIGGMNADQLVGGKGNDVIEGKNGADLVYGNDGNDSILSGGHADTIFGGKGADTLNAGQGRDVAYLNHGNDVFVDVLQSGSNGSDYVDGGWGDDRLESLDGNDTLIGNLGSDTIIGGSGVNRIVGGADNDDLKGGGGADVFVFGETETGIDVIQDFENGVDKIEVQGLTFSDIVEVHFSGSGGVRLRFPDGSEVQLLGVTHTSINQDDYIFV